MFSDLLAWLVALIASFTNPVLTLDSLEQIDGYPLYTMHYYGDYEQNVAIVERAEADTFVPTVASARPVWGCSLFTVLADPDSALYGRNFDWDYSPAVLLFTHPADGYDSVSMVDIAYLGFGGQDAHGITDLPLLERVTLLNAPFWPFDGMNEHGLVIGMAAVPDSAMPYDPGKATVDSLIIIREVLDHARTVDEALAIFDQVNIDWGGGPALHYLIADATGHSVLVEFYAGEMIVLPGQQPWNMATNFLHAPVSTDLEDHCWRYRTISDRLMDRDGRLTIPDAMALLHDVSQDITQWSIVYSIGTGEIAVAMHGQYDAVHTFSLPLAIE